MIIRFCTKRDINGNRKILIIDENTKEYSQKLNMFFCRSDFVEVSATDLKKLRQTVENNGYAINENLI